MTTLTEQDLNILDELAKADPDGYHTDPGILVDGPELAKLLERDPEELDHRLQVLEGRGYLRRSLTMGGNAPLEDTAVLLTRAGRTALVEARYADELDHEVDDLTERLVVKGEHGVFRLDSLGHETSVPSWVTVEASCWLERRGLADFSGARSEYLKPTAELLWGTD
jgi:hypothetical protein